jgi:hypothetical protein
MSVAGSLDTFTFSDNPTVVHPSKILCASTLQTIGNLVVRRKLFELKLRRDHFYPSAALLPKILAAAFQFYKSVRALCPYTRVLGACPDQHHRPIQMWSAAVARLLLYGSVPLASGTAIHSAALVPADPLPQG